MSPTIDLFIYLSFCLSICLSIYLSICLSNYLSTYLSIYLTIYLSIYLFIHLSIYLCIYRSIYLSIDRSIYLSIYLSRYLSIHRAASLSIYLSIDLAPQASIFFSMQKNHGCRSAHGIIFLRRQTVVRWVRKKHNDARDNFGTCCRVRSAARKNTRFIQSGAAKPAPGLCALEKNCDAESGRRSDGPEETPSTVAPWVRKKKNIIPETTLVATQVHVAESEARPEETHASFKAVLPNLRHGCALGETLRRRKRTPHRWARRNTIRAVFERDHRRPQDHLQKEATGSRPCIY